MLLGHVTAAWSTSRTSSPAGRLLLEDKAADRARRGSGRRHWHSGGWTFSPADRHAVPEPLWAAPHLQAAAKRQVTPRVTHEASKSQSPTCWEALKWAEGTWGGPLRQGLHGGGRRALPCPRRLCPEASRLVWLGLRVSSVEATAAAVGRASGRHGPRASGGAADPPPAAGPKQPVGSQELQPITAAVWCPATWD